MNKKQLLALGAALTTAHAFDRQAERERAAQENKTGLSANYAPLQGWGPYVTGEALIFKAQQPGRKFTVNLNAVQYNDHGIIVNATGISPCNHYDPGFRVGLGYTLPCHEEWDIYGYYTQFDTNGYQKITAVGALEPIASLSYPYAEYPASGATCCWKLHFKTIDFELGREFYIGSFLHIKPHVGVRGAKISEDMVVSYTSVLYNSKLHADKLNLCNTFAGAGVQFGLNTQWELFKTCHCGDISLYGDAAWALLTGHTKLSTDEVIDITVPIVQGTEYFKALIAAQTLAIGVRWDKTFFCDRVHARIHFGWEQHYYTNMWNFISTVLVTDLTLANGNLGLSGFAVGARIDF